MMPAKRDDRHDTAEGDHNGGVTPVMASRPFGMSRDEGHVAQAECVDETATPRRLLGEEVGKS